MDDRTITRLLRRSQKKNASYLTLDHGSRVAVIGGGPAGSFFSYFLLDMVERIGLKIHVDIYEPRDFEVPGPAGCNMCGGVIYESLVQSLAIEGINLPTNVVQRSIGCNMLHLDIGSAQIQTPRNEKRITTTFRGNGPKGSMEFKGVSLDSYLMRTVVAKGGGREVNTMSLGALGKNYQDGEIIVHQGELGDCMYVVQEGHVEVIIESENHQVQLNILGKNEFFGEMAIFDHEIRSGTVRALGSARILTVDHKNLLRRIHEDPSLVYLLLQVMSYRIRRLSEGMAELNRNPDSAVPVFQTANGKKV